MKKKVILITGGSDGLGKETARQLADSHQVIILARSEDKLRYVSEELSVDYRVVDVRNNEDINTAVYSIQQQYQTIDVLVNSAGIWIEGDLDNNSSEDIYRALSVNTVGPMLMAKAVAPIMKKQKDGHIINVISCAGKYKKRHRSVYAASKWGLRGFTENLQKDYQEYNIRVSGFYPAKIKTELFAKAGIEKNMENAMEVFDVAHSLCYLINLPAQLNITNMDLQSVCY